jgi:hypothetical protein
MKHVTDMWGNAKKSVTGAWDNAKKSATDAITKATGLLWPEVDPGKLAEFQGKWQNLGQLRSGNAAPNAKSDATKLDAVYKEFLKLDSKHRKAFLEIYVKSFKVVELTSGTELSVMPVGYAYKEKSESELIRDFAAHVMATQGNNTIDGNSQNDLLIELGIQIEFFEKLTNAERSRVIKRGLLFGAMGLALLVYSVPFMYSQTTNALQAIPSVLLTAKSQVAAILASDAVASLPAATLAKVTSALTAAQTQLTAAASLAGKAVFSAETLATMSQYLTVAQTQLSTAFATMYAAIPKERMGAALSQAMLKLSPLLSTAQTHIATAASGMIAALPKEQIVHGIAAISGYLNTHLASSVKYFGINPKHIPSMAKLVGQAVVALGSPFAMVSLWREYTQLGETQAELEKLQTYKKVYKKGFNS